MRDQIAEAWMSKEPHSLKRALQEYYEYKCLDGEENRDLKNRISRLSKDLINCLNKYKFESVEISSIKRSDANTLRDYLLNSMSPSSVKRNIGVVKAAVNLAIKEHDLDAKNPFEGLIIRGAAV